MKRVEFDGLCGFQTFLHTVSEDNAEGAMPRRSIVMSPVVSIGIGWAVVDEGTGKGVVARLRVR